MFDANYGNPGHPSR